MKRKRLSIKKLIILTAILIFIIISILIIQVYRGEKAKEDYGYEIMGVYKPQNQVTNENTGEISLKNIEILGSFNGELPVSTITQKIKDIFINKIPDIKGKTENMDEKSLKEFYEQNSKEIKKNLRIDNEECFLNMISDIRKINCDLKEDSEECEFLSNENISLKYTYSNGQYITCIITGRNANNFLLEF